MADKDQIRGLPILMRAQLEAEFSLAHNQLEHRINLLRQVLSGLATNSTQCKMCRLHVGIYRDALARDDSLAT
jgi:hypothetical protein